MHDETEFGVVYDSVSLSDATKGMGASRLSVSEKWARVTASFELPSEYRSLAELRGIHGGKNFVILGSGPSINDTLPELLDLVAKGAKIIAINAAHDWLLAKGITPHFGLMADPKPWVVDYQTPTAGVKYLIASQCDPSVFERFKGHGGVYVWHLPPHEDAHEITPEAMSMVRDEVSDAAERMKALAQKHNRHLWVSQEGGSTGGMRAFDITTYFGSIGDHLFGMDSSGVREPGADHTEMHGHPKPHIAKQFQSPVYLRDSNGLDLVTEYWTNNPMAQQALQWEHFLRARIEGMRNGTYPVKVVTVYGTGLFPDWAALRGLHVNSDRAEQLRAAGHRPEFRAPVFHSLMGEESSTQVDLQVKFTHDPEAPGQFITFGDA